MRSARWRHADGKWLLLALAAHALLIGAARLAFDEEPSLSRAPERAFEELDVEYDVTEPATAPKAEAPAPAEDVESDAPHAPARPPRGTPDAPLEAEAPPEVAVLDTDAARAGEAAAAPIEGLDEAPATGEVDLGIGPDAWQRWAALGREAAPRAARSAPRAGAYETPGAPQRSTTGGLQEGLEAHDRKLGLGPRGRVISAFHGAASAWEAPQLGTASFHVTVTKTGEVEISVGAHSGDTDKWRAVAAHAAAALKKAPPRISSARKGVRLVIDLVAEETYPNGVNPKDLYGPRLEAQAPQLKSTEETKKELEADNPTAGKNPNDPIPQFPLKFELPGVYLSQRGKVCGYRLGVTPVGLALQGGCDPSNAGAKPQRIVRAKVRDEAMF